MVLQSARKAAKSLFSERARGVVLKSLGLTVLLFLGLWFGLQQLATYYLLPVLEGWSFIATSILWLLGVGIVIGAGFLLAPVTAIFAGLFLDEVAERVEKLDYPADKPGQAYPMAQAMLLALRFGMLVLFANLIALLLVWLAGFGVIIFFLLNGYLLGREYFQFAAMRFRSSTETKELTSKYSLEIFLAGLIIAAVMSIPLVNLLTPVFAAILMVHLHKSLSYQQPE